MGKAKIVAHLGNAEYTITKDYDQSRSTVAYNKLTTEKAEIEINTIPRLQGMIATDEANLETARAGLEAAMDNWNLLRTDEARAEVDKWQADANKFAGYLGARKEELAEAELRRDAIQKHLDLLLAKVQSDVNVSAWCADRSDGVNGADIPVDTVVGTIEMNGQESSGVIIQPGHNNNAVYDQNRDGQMNDPLQGGPAELFYNRAVMPGWQKYVHQYRSGTITAKSTTVFDVTLDNILSVEASVPINDLDAGGLALTGVTASYMTCDADAFNVADSVVVKLTYTDLGLPSESLTAQIVGFTDNPKPCQPGAFVYFPDGGGNTDWQYIDSDTGAWVMTTPFANDMTGVSSAKFKRWRVFFGPEVGQVPQIVHWERSFASDIFVNGAQRATLAGSMAFYYLEGVGLTPDNAFLVATAYKDSLLWVLRKTNTWEPTGEAYNASTNPDGWEVVGSYDMGLYRKTSVKQFEGSSVWSFNQSCTRALCLHEYQHGEDQVPPAPSYSGHPYSTERNANDDWMQELEITIVDPSVAAPLTGVAFDKHDPPGGGGISTRNFYEHYFCPSGIEENYQKIEHSGKSAAAVGFRGDTAIYLYEEATGYDEYLYTCNGDTLTRVSTTVNYGNRWVCSEIGLDIPKQIANATSPMTRSWDGSCYNFNETWDQVSEVYDILYLDLNQLCIFFVGAKRPWYETRISHNCLEFTITTPTSYGTHNAGDSRRRLFILSGQVVHQDEIEVAPLTTTIDDTNNFVSSMYNDICGGWGCPSPPADIDVVNELADVSFTFTLNENLGSFPVSAPFNLYYATAQNGAYCACYTMDSALHTHLSGGDLETLSGYPGVTHGGIFAVGI